MLALRSVGVLNRRRSLAMKLPPSITIYALRRLVDLKCQHAPWLLDCMKLTVQAGTHPEAIVGGYLTLVLMDKLPGVCLNYEYLCGLSFADRENLREDFKKPIINVWSTGLLPVDSASRNIIWNREARMFYIIDFEGCDIDFDKTYQPPEFRDVQYCAWQISEKVLFPKQRW